MYELYVNLHEDGDFQRQIKTDIIEFFIVSCSTFRLDSVCLVYIWKDLFTSLFSITQRSKLLDIQFSVIS